MNLQFVINWKVDHRLRENRLHEPEKSSEQRNGETKMKKSKQPSTAWWSNEVDGMPANGENRELIEWITQMNKAENQSERGWFGMWKTAAKRIYLKAVQAELEERKKMLCNCNYN